MRRDQDANGIVSVPGTHSVDDTVARLRQALEAKGVKVFAIVDHSGGAAQSGFAMPNTKLVIFGNPKAGTPMMLAAPSAAIDLPLKILIAQDTNQQVWISYNSPDYLIARHHLPAESAKALEVVAALVKAIAS